MTLSLEAATVAHCVRHLVHTRDGCQQTSDHTEDLLNNTRASDIHGSFFQVVPYYGVSWKKLLMMFWSWYLRKI